MTKISYAEYRQHMEELSFLKKRFNKLLAEQKHEFAQYRKHWKKYRQLKEEAEKAREELIKQIPNKF